MLVKILYDVFFSTSSIKERILILSVETVCAESSNAPAEGIHIIRREPWTAVTTDMEGRFEIELESGYQLLELQGVMIKDARRHLMLYADADVRIELEDRESVV